MDSHILMEMNALFVYTSKTRDSQVSRDLILGVDLGFWASNQPWVTPFPSQQHMFSVNHQYN